MEVLDTLMQLRMQDDFILPWPASLTHILMLVLVKWHSSIPPFTKTASGNLTIGLNGYTLFPKDLLFSKIVNMQRILILVSTSFLLCISAFAQKHGQELKEIEISSASIVCYKYEASESTDSTHLVEIEFYNRGGETLCLTTNNVLHIKSVINVNGDTIQIVNPIVYHPRQLSDEGYINLAAGERKKAKFYLFGLSYFDMKKGEQYIVNLEYVGKYNPRRINKIKVARENILLPSLTLRNCMDWKPFQLRQPTSSN